MQVKLHRRLSDRIHHLVNLSTISIQIKVPVFYANLGGILILVIHIRDVQTPAAYRL